MPKIRRIFERVDEKKEQKKRKTAGIIIALVMLFSTAAFAFMDSSSTTNNTGIQKYKDYTFKATDLGWTTTANSQSITTQFLPQDVENISSSQFISGDLGNTIFFIADSYDERQAASELSGVLSSQRKQFACLPEDSNQSECADLPLKNCDSASAESGVIIIKESNETSVNYNNFCITINGNATELVKAADKAIFKIAGII